MGNRPRLQGVRLWAALSADATPDHSRDAA
jgi:hypothetical protein